MTNMKFCYLNYEKYSKMFENNGSIMYDGSDYNDNYNNNRDNNMNLNRFNNIKDEKLIDPNIKSNLDFSKIFYEKNRILLNRFTQEFYEEINVKIFSLLFKNKGL